MEGLRLNPVTLSSFPLKTLEKVARSLVEVDLQLLQKVCTKRVIQLPLGEQRYWLLPGHATE